MFSDLGLGGGIGLFLVVILFVVGIALLFAQLRLFSIDRSLKRIVELLELRAVQDKSHKSSSGQSFTL